MADSLTVAVRQTKKMADSLTVAVRQTKKMADSLTVAVQQLKDDRLPHGRGSATKKMTDSLTVAVRQTKKMTDSLTVAVQQLKDGRLPHGRGSETKRLPHRSATKKKTGGLGSPPGPHASAAPSGMQLLRGHEAFVDKRRSPLSFAGADEIDATVDAPDGRDS